jgi:SPP1 family predicted phage head-tail adaptor
MNSGDLDRIIVIEKSVQVQSTSGQMVDSWIRFARVWAQEIPFSSNERFSSQATHTAILSHFKIRYLKGLDPKMRISYDNQYWRILGFTKIGRLEGWDITAEVIQ